MTNEKAFENVPLKGILPVCKHDRSKVFAVDSYVSLCKVFRIEAGTREEAEGIAMNRIGEMLQDVDEMEAGRVLADNGFHGCDDVEVKASGEADESGEIKYY